MLFRLVLYAINKLICHLIVFGIARIEDEYYATHALRFVGKTALAGVRIEAIDLAIGPARMWLTGLLK